MSVGTRRRIKILECVSTLLIAGMRPCVRCIRPGAERVTNLSCPALKTHARTHVDRVCQQSCRSSRSFTSGRTAQRSPVIHALCLPLPSGRQERDWFQQCCVTKHTKGHRRKLNAIRCGHKKATL